MARMPRLNNRYNDRSHLPPSTGRGSELLNTGQGISVIMPDASHSQPLNPSRPGRPGASIPWTTSRASVAKIPSAPSTAGATPQTSPSAAATASTTTSACSTARPANTASPSARARPCSRPTCPSRRPAPCSSTSLRAAASDRPGAWSTSTATPSPAWRRWPANTPATLMTSSWLFPPRTREVQFDEMWAFVGKKQQNCDPANPADDHKGDWWDHVAYDPQHKLVVAVVPGARVTESIEEVVTETKDRLDEQPPALMTSDDYAVYETVIEEVFSQPVVASPEPAGPGRRPLLPERRLDPGVTYATVRKRRKNNRVGAVHRTVVL